MVGAGNKVSGPLFSLLGAIPAPAAPRITVAPVPCELSPPWPSRTWGDGGWRMGGVPEEQQRLHIHHAFIVVCLLPPRLLQLLFTAPSSSHLNSIQTPSKLHPPKEVSAGTYHPPPSSAISLSIHTPSKLMSHTIVLLCFVFLLFIQSPMSLPCMQPTSH